MELFSLFATLSLETSNFTSGVKQARSQGEGLAGSLTQNVKASTIAMGNLLADFAKAAGQATVEFGKKAFNLSADLEQNLGGSEAVFGEYAQGIQTAGAEAYKLMGLSQSDFLETANKMGSLLKGSGFGVDEASKLAVESMQRASDVASIMGIDVGSAMEAVTGAMKGNFTMMDNLGVAINDTTLAQYALEKGITKSTAKMTTQEKVGLAMELFMERTAYAAGNYVKELDTWSGAYTTMQASFENFLTGTGTVEEFVDSVMNAGRVAMRSLGEIVPRLGSSMLEAVRLFIPHIAELGKTIWNEKLPTILTNGANGLIDLVNKIFGTNIPHIDTIELPTWEEISQSVTDWWTDFKTKFAGIGENLGGIGAGVASIIGQMLPGQDEFGDFDSSLSSAWDNVLLFNEDVFGLINSIVTWISENQEAITLVEGIFIAALAAVDPFRAALVLVAINWESIKNAIDVTWSAISNFFSFTVPEWFNTQIQKIADWFYGVESAVRSAIKAVQELFGINTGGGPLTVEEAQALGYDQRKVNIGIATGEIVPNAKGLNYVPYDNYLTRLHKGETVLSAVRAEEYRSGQSSGFDVSEMKFAIVDAVREGMRGLAVNMNGQAVGDIVTETVSRNIAQKAWAGRY